MSSTEEFRVTFNPRYVPEGMDKDGYVVIEAVDMDDAVAAADAAYPGGWNMVYRAAVWFAANIEHLFPAGEVARLTTGRATIAQAAELGPVLTEEETASTDPAWEGWADQSWGDDSTYSRAVLIDPQGECPTCGTECKGHFHWEVLPSGEARKVIPKEGA